MAAPRPINERFTDEYSQQASIKPSTGMVRKIQVNNQEPANDPTIRRVKVDKNPDFNAPAANEAVYNKKSNKKSKRKKDKGGKGESKPILPAITKRQRLKRRARKGGVKGKLAEIEIQAKARVKAIRVSAPFFTVGGYVWLFFQLPLALLSLVFLGLASIVSDLESGILAQAATTIVDAAQVINPSLRVTEYLLNRAIGALASSLNIEFSLLDIADVFFYVTYLLIWFWGMFVLLLMYLLYRLSFINPLGGSGSGLKYGALILAIVGYSVPLLNLIPWHMAWALVVIYKPK